MYVLLRRALSRLCPRIRLAGPGRIAVGGSQKSLILSLTTSKQYGFSWMIRDMSCTSTKAITSLVSSVCMPFQPKSWLKGLQLARNSARNDMPGQWPTHQCLTHPSARRRSISDPAPHSTFSNNSHFLF
jgi:hypothetical protein